MCRSFQHQILQGKLDMLLHVQKRLEEDLMRREAEVEELMQALDIHRRNTKNEKRRRAQQAFKVIDCVNLI